MAFDGGMHGSYELFEHVEQLSVFHFLMFAMYSSTILA